MKSIVKKIMLTVLIAAFFSPIAFSQRGEGLNLNRLDSKLNFTDSQKDQIEKLRLDHQKAMIDQKAKLDKARLELKEVTSKEDFTRNEFLAAHNKLAKLREDIQIAIANHKMDILDLMNKDQRKILSENKTFRQENKNFGRRGRGDCSFDNQRMGQRKRIHQ